MCVIDSALIFYPTAVAALAYTGVKLWRKYNESKKESNGKPTANEQQHSISSE